MVLTYLFLACKNSLFRIAWGTIGKGLFVAFLFFLKKKETTAILRGRRHFFEAGWHSHK